MTYPKDLDTQIKQLEVSIEYHCKALSICPKYFVYRPNIESSLTEQYAQLGHCYYQKNDLSKAIRVYSQARATDPDHFQVLYQLGMTYRQRKQFEDARDCFHEIIERVEFKHDYHHQIDAWLGIVRTYIEEGKETSLAKAEKYILLVRAVAPNHPDLKAIDEILARQQKVTHLIKQMRKHLADQQWRQANTTLKEIKQLNPHHHEILQLEQTLYHAVSQDALTSYTGGLFHIKPALHSDKNKVETMINGFEFNG